MLSNYGWSGVMIEANKKKFQELKKNYSGNARVHLINRFVSFEGTGTLDNILKSTPIPKDFDLLSIDIDGNDYYIWETVVEFSPKVVVIEFNQTIPSDVRFVQEKNVKINHGASILSITELAQTKGYELITATICNAIFVKKQYFDLFGIEDNSPSILWDQEAEAPRIFQLYDGTIALSKEFELLWNNVNVKRFDLQKLPKHLRVFSDSQDIKGIFRKFLFKLYKKSN
jgi:hypothetical protein